MQAVNPKDLDLLARIGRGDERAMACLYDRHSSLVFSVALRVCREATAAEEVTQELFMQVWLEPQEFVSGPESLDGRLAILSRNLAIALMRRCGASEEPSRSFNPVSQTQVSRLMQKPQALVLLLPDADRQVLEMAFFDGKTPAQIAEDTGFPIETIASRFRSGLSALRKGAADAANVLENSVLEVLDLDTHGVHGTESPYPAY